MVTTDAQVRKLMEELSKGRTVEQASAKSSMHRNTGTKYRRLGKLPSDLRAPRTWRTRDDPFAEDWPAIAARLADAPELEARALFEDLIARRPECYEPGQLRTLQRRVRRWRAQEGPPKEVFFAQEHRPGEALQTDFTSTAELGITICGEPFPHLLCHSVLPYSNWESACTARSESMLAIRLGVQTAVFRLGRVPEFHQTDNSTAATHNLRTGKRGFNEEYEALMRHLGMKPRTTEVGEKEQNGDVEALHGVMKRRLRQHLLLRGSTDFESIEAYESWRDQALEKANALRATKVREELAVMRPLEVGRLVECHELRVPVTSWSTIRVLYNAYSVPSRLIGETVTVRVYDYRIEVHLGGERQLETERLIGRNGRAINYRHIIWWLVRKPGAFARYRYREDLFPSLVFRRAYDAVVSRLGAGIKADVEYLRVLHLAAATMESDVEAALTLLLAAGTTPTAEAVKAVVDPAKPSVPDLAAPKIDLTDYDTLLSAARDVTA